MNTTGGGLPLLSGHAVTFSRYLYETTRIVVQINDDWYHMEHRSVAKRSTEPHLEVHQRLIKDSRIRRAEQQRAKSRTKRDLIIKRPSNILTMLNDERWPQMWYLVSEFNQ